MKRIPKGRTLVLRTCNPDMTSHHSKRFTYPESGPVACKDWKSTKECGNGLHGFANGVGNGSLVNWGTELRWLVISVETATLVDLGGKVKFPGGDVVHCGDLPSAVALLASYGITEGVIGGTATAGYSGTATAGDRGTATAGYSGTATAGEEGCISLLHWNGSTHKRKIGLVGDGGLKPHVAYQLDAAGEFTEVTP